MTIVIILKTETELSDLVARAEAGEEIILARGDKPVVKLVPVKTEKRRVEGYGRFAHLKDQLPASVFLEPMAEDELDAWEGRYSFPGDNGQ